MVTVLLLVGCQTAPRRSVDIAGASLPIDDARADVFLSDYFAQASERTGLRGSARVSLTGPDFRLNRPQRIVVERPGRLRFEVLGLFDQLAAVLVSDGRRFGFFEASTRRISRGHVTPTLLWDLAKIDLAPEEMVGLLLGAPEPSAGLSRAGVWLSAKGGVVVAFAWASHDQPEICDAEPERRRFDAVCYVSAAGLADGGEVFYFDSEGRLVEFHSLESGGELRFRAVFEKYSALAGSDGVIFPNQVTVQSPSVESEATFVWKRVMLDSPLSDRLFTLPEGPNERQGG